MLSGSDLLTNLRKTAGEEMNIDFLFKKALFCVNQAGSDVISPYGSVFTAVCRKLFYYNLIL